VVCVQKLVVCAVEIDVIVVPLVGTADCHHVCVLVMIVVDTVEHGGPGTEIFLTINENLRGFAALVHLDGQLNGEGTIEGHPVQMTEGPATSAHCVLESGPGTQMLDDHRVIRMPHIEHLHGILVAEPGTDLTTSITDIWTAAELTLEELVLGLEPGNTVHTFRDKARIVRIIRIGDLLKSELVEPRRVEGLGVENTTIMGHMLFASLPDGGSAGVGMPGAGSGGHGTSTCGCVSQQRHSRAKSVVVIRA